MATFPSTETEVAALALTMVGGFDDNVGVYPSPPVAMLDMTALLNAYNDAKGAIVAATAAAEAATSAKVEALNELVAARVFIAIGKKLQIWETARCISFAFGPFFDQFRLSHRALFTDYKTS